MSDELFREGDGESGDGAERADAASGRPPVPGRRAVRPRKAGPLHIGGTVLQTFVVAGRILPILLPVAVALEVPKYLYSRHAMERAWNAYVDYHAASMIPSSLEIFVAQEHGWLGAGLFVLLSLLLHATVTIVVLQAMRGQRPGLLKALGQGMGRLPLAFVATVLAVVLLLLVLIVVGMLGGALLPGQVISFLLILLLVSAILVATFYPFVQVAVVEAAGPFQALSRAAHLTRGVRGRVLLFLLLFMGVGLSVTTWLQIVSMRDPQRLQDLQQSLILEHALGAVFGALAAVGGAVLYHDLRRSKEGVDVGDLLRVFE